MRSSLRIDNKKTAQRLEEARRAKRLNQSQLAQAVKLNQAQVNRILAGKFQRLSTGVNSLCDYLHVIPVMKKTNLSLSQYPELATCLSEVLDGSRKRERALIRLVKSARILS